MGANPLVVERLVPARGSGILCLQGPLTMENVMLFQSAVRREENADTVIFDLSQVPFIDSAGLGSLVSAYVSRQKAGRKVALTGVNERIMKLFKITRVEGLFLIFRTIDAAVDALSNAAQA
jgi:anti-sigma B factor antagonist